MAGRLTHSPSHEIAHLAVAVGCARCPGHDAAGVVAHEARLAADGRHVAIFHPAKRAGGKTCAVDHHVRLRAGVVLACGVGDVAQDGAADDDARFHALRDEPGEVDGGVDAHGRVADGGGEAAELGLGEMAELWGVLDSGKGEGDCVARVR